MNPSLVDYYLEYSRPWDSIGSQTTYGGGKCTEIFIEPPYMVSVGFTSRTPQGCSLSHAVFRGNVPPLDHEANLNGLLCIAWVCQCLILAASADSDMPLAPEQHLCDLHPHCSACEPLERGIGLQSMSEPPAWSPLDLASLFARSLHQLIG